MKWRDIAALVKEMTEKDLDQPALLQICRGDYVEIAGSDSMALRHEDGSIDFENGQHYFYFNW